MSLRLIIELLLLGVGTSKTVANILNNDTIATIRDKEEKAMELENAGVTLLNQYKHPRHVSLLNKAISLLRQACVLFPVEHSRHYPTLINLATALLRCYECSGNVGALVECADLYHKALALRPHGHSDRTTLLSNLSIVLMTHYKHNSNTNALFECIDLRREEVSQLPRSHPGYPMSLGSLAAALLTYYEHSHNMNELLESININRDALSLFPQDNPERARLLNNLAVTLMRRYQHCGDMDALMECIDLSRNALSLRPKGHTSRAGSLNNLSSALMAHYEDSGDMDVLSECVDMSRDALALRPKQHPDRANSLINLANVLKIQSDNDDNIDGLLECIDMQREALALSPKGHPNYEIFLRNLANSLRKRYERSSDINALLECIDLHRSVLAMHPQGHPDRAESLLSLSSAYMYKYQLTWHDQALQNALHSAKESLKCFLSDSPRRQSAYYTIASIQLRGSRYDLREAVNYLTLAIKGTSTTPRTRLKYAIELLHAVEQASMRQPAESNPAQQVLAFYLLAVELLPLVANHGLNNGSRLRELAESEQLCRAAAVQAILCGKLPLAVQVYEEGKGVFWAQALLPRSTALDVLPPEDREELVNLFHQLEIDDFRSGINIKNRAKYERWVESKRQLNIQVGHLLANIRQRPGFDRFLRIPLYESLKHAAIRGPVVILVSSERGCFAIVVQAESSPGIISLETMNGGGLQKLHDMVSGAGMRNYEDRPDSIDWEEASQSSENEGRPCMKRLKPLDTSQEGEALFRMWRDIVKPVIDHLKLQPVGKIDLVYTGVSGEIASLPLHAAGSYDIDQNRQTGAAAYMVSSYTPTLSALIRARENFVAVPRQDIKLALYADSGGRPGFSYLSNVGEEVRRVTRVLRLGSVTVQSSVNEVFDVNAFAERTNTAHILHLTCHGQQEKDALKSCFALDPPLTISALMTLELPNATLAYLSACETAKGDKNQPDQAVHLAASMLFCGFRSVVATMWTMNDLDGPSMAAAFYEELMKNEVINLDDIPYALDAAVEKLRKSVRSVRRWATYIHVGA